MKKIILSNNKLSGVNLFRSGLIKELEKNYELMVIADKDNEDNKNKYSFINLNIDRRGLNPFKDVLLLFNYIKILVKEKPDLVTHYTIKPNIYGSLACRILKIPYINTINGCGSAFLRNGLIGKIVRKLYKISLKNSKKIFFQNNDDLNEFLSRKIIKKAQCIYVPGSGVDLKKFKKSLKKKNDKVIFLFIGRLIKEKGILLFCKAAEHIKKENKNIEFRILGPINKEEKDSISLEKIKKLEEEGIVKYLGVSKDVRNEIKEVDCILFPSYYREGVPRSLLESGAMGKAIITTNSVGCKDTVIDNENGYLLEPNNLQSILDKVQKYIDLPQEEKEKMGDRSREIIEKLFDEKIVFETYKKVIKNILEE